MKRVRTNSDSADNTNSNSHRVLSDFQTRAANVTSELTFLVEKLDESRASLDSTTKRFSENSRTAMAVSRTQSDLVTLNVGGTVHTVSRCLLTQHPSSLLYQLVTRSPGTEVATNAQGHILLDRDGELFRHILSYLRGYRPRLVSEEADALLHELEYYQLVDLHAEVLANSQPDHLLFEYGGGVTLERTRFRSSYCVSPVGDLFLMQGKHSITFQVKMCEYLGFGVISDACTSYDQEFHKTPLCCVYYMTGVFYSNFPHHKKEEGLEKFARDDTVTILMDLDDKVITFLKNTRVVRVVQCGVAIRLRFAVVAKLDSEVVIVPDSHALDHAAVMAASTTATTISTTSATATSGGVLPPPPPPLLPGGSNFAFVNADALGNNNNNNNNSNATNSEPAVDLSLSPIQQQADVGMDSNLGDNI
eukprot:PhM_4_TR2876/c0_g1_i1/m.54989